jgi:hypothetical protein
VIRQNPQIMEMRTWDSIYNYQPLQVWQNLKHCNPQRIRILLVPAYGWETLQKICVLSPLGQDNTTQSDNRTFMPRWHLWKKLGIEYKTTLLFSDWSHIWWVNLLEHSWKKDLNSRRAMKKNRLREIAYIYRKNQEVSILVIKKGKSRLTLLH